MAGAVLLCIVIPGIASPNAWKRVRPGTNPPAYAAFSKSLSKEERFQHALDRLTFGPRPEDFREIHRIGQKKWIDRQLQPEELPENPALEHRLKPFDPLGMSVRDIAADLSQDKLLRAIYSNRQLEELLVDFWYNHFNVFLGKGADRYLVPAYERETIRPHVLGKFYDLLLATAQSPAMLFYLDNWQSVSPDISAGRFARPNQKAKRGLNENYGRELLELHTLGVDGGYTQKDVIEVARCFTGWTIANPPKGGSFKYNDKVHDQGQKVVLGHLIPAGGGRQDGLDVLGILARHPSTAHFISLKLAQRFVSDDPPPSLVNRMAQTFLQTDGDLREVMRTMLSSPEFWSQGAYRAKVKTPLELVVGAMRATHADVTSALSLGNQLQKLGEPLYRKIDPNGYSSAGVDWVSSAGLLDRIKFAVALSHNLVPGVQVDTSQALVAGLVIGSPDFQRH